MRRQAREEELRQAALSAGQEESGNPAEGRPATFLHVAGMLLLGSAVLIGGLVVLMLLALLVVYILKTGMGIDIFKDTHLGDLLFR